MSNNYTAGERGDRPWGHWVADEVGEGFVKKIITVNPGECLSLQSHEHREENWTIVSGTAEVTIDENVVVLESGNEVSIPKRAKHRLKNAGSDILVVREIQTGEILDENDIVRYSDVYGRN